MRRSYPYNDDGQTNVPTGLTGVQAIAAGRDHTVALKSDGTVLAWGWNNRGQCSVPTGLTGVQAIAAGESHTVALKSDGTVVAWGDNYQGQTTLPDGLTGVQAIAAGGFHTMTLKSDGTVVAWGRNVEGQTTVPAGLTGVTAIAAGFAHTVALKNNGTVVAWGYNDNESGNGRTTVPAGLTGVTAIAAGFAHTVALKSNGTVVAWGDNYFGQRTVPAGLTGVQAIAAGRLHTVVIADLPPEFIFANQIVATTSAVQTFTVKNTGVADLNLGTFTLGGTNPGDFSVSAAGSSIVAPGGSTTFTVRFTPAVHGARSAVLHLPSNDPDRSTFDIRLAGFGVSTDATLSSLRLITGTLSPAFSPATTSYGSTVPYTVTTNQCRPTAAQAGATITVNGSTVTSGNYSSAVNLVAGADTVFTIIVTATDLVTTKTYTVTVTRPGDPEIVVEHPASTALLSGVVDGGLRVMSWGRNVEGQTTVPAGLTGVTAIAAGYAHTVALKNNGTVVAWGKNDYGQRDVPVDLTGVTAIAAGVYHTVALKSDGTIVAWGSNGDGQRDVPVELTGVTAIAAGGFHTVALKSDGTVVAWGRNSEGQTTVPDDLTGVMAIAAGRFHTVALKSDGTVVAWGDNYSGQTTVPDGLTGVQAIAAGESHTVALKSDGTVLAWGRNNEGQTTVPVGLTGVQAITAGWYYTVALKSDGTVVAWGQNIDGQITTMPVGLTGVTAIAAGLSHTVALFLTPVVAFGDQIIATSAAKTFVIRNTGEGANLILSTITLDGVNAADFTVSVPGSSSIAPGGSTTFTVTFNPSVIGNRKAMLHIPSNDADESITHIVLTGSGVTGQPDSGFNAAIVGAVTTSALQPDGKLIFGGSFTSVGGVTRNGIARLNADDSLDTSFDPNVTGGVSSVLVLESKQIVIAGSFSSVGGTTRGNIARLNEDGTVDATFNPTANGAISCLALQADDKIVIGGDFTTLKPNGASAATTRNRIARLNAIGTLDTFNPNANLAVRCIALQSDGSMIVGGDFTALGATTRNRIARLTTAGVVDTTFNPGASGGTVASVTVLPDGNLIVAGSFSTIAGSAHQSLAKLSAAGVLDASYTATTNGSVQSVALQANGSIIIGGSFTIAGGSPRNNSARIRADGSLDIGYVPSVLGAGSVAVNSVMIQEDGKVFLGGSFSNVSGLVCGNLVRYVSTAATQTLAPIGTDIEWQRGGAAAEAVEVAFDLSADGGDTWTFLAAGTRMTGGWQATGVTLSSVNGLLRGRARTLSGQNNGSSGWAVFQAPYSLPAAEIVVEQPVNNDLIDGADTIAFGTLGLNALKPIVVTIRNAGGQPLTGLKVTIDGANANQFSITDQPDTTVGALDSTTFTVQAKVTTSGAKVAALHIASNDADESPFDINLTATGATAVLPIVSPKAATNVSYTSATVNGTVDAKGSPREIFFDVGTTTAVYTDSIAATPATLDTSGVTNVSADLSGLLPHTKYFYRVRTVGDLGNLNSTELNFTTLNNAPVGVADTGTVVLPGAVATIDVLANDTDADGDTLTITKISTAPPSTAGTVAIAADKLSLTFTAKDTFSGSATFGYTLSDGIATTTANVTVSNGGISLNPPSITQPAAGVTYPLEIITDGAWAVSEALAWATVTPTRGVGRSTVQVTLQPNPSKTARPVGVLKIGGVSHTITQSGVQVPTLDQALSGTTVPAIVSGAFSLPIPTVNAPVTYAVTNLPLGLTLDNTTGIISGLPTTAGSKNVVIKATNAAATTAGAAATLSFTINVDALPAGTVGTFHGYVERSSTVNLTPVPDLGARFEMTTTSTGAITGQVYEGVTKKAFTGQLAATLADPKHPTLLGILTGMSQRLELTLDSDNNSLIGLLRDASSSNATPITAWRNPWQTVAPINKASAYKVQHNFAIENTSPGGPDGFGYGSFVVTEKDGSLTITGKLADGSALLCTTFIGQDGQVLLYQALHANRGSCFGKLTVTPVNAPTDNTVTGALSWLKPASLAAAKDTLYAAGFGPLDLTVMGSTYIAPAKGQRVLGLPAPAATPVTATNAKLAFTLGGLVPDFDQLIRVANPSTTGLTNTATVAAYNALGTPNPNPNKVAITTFTAATGLFAGSYIIPGATTALNRNAPFFGQIVRVFGPTTTTQGYGHFLLPSVPTGAQTVTTSPKLSGSVELKP